MTSAENNGGTAGGITGRGFRPGQSGNPGGRPRSLAKITREVVGDDGRAIAEFWLATMNDPAAKLSERLEASRLLADRGWGKPGVFEPLEVESGLRTRLTIEEIDREIQQLEAEIAARDSPRGGPQP